MKKINANILLFKALSLSAVFCICVSFLYAQPVLPQRSITVTPTQAINFGSFCVSPAGGTVSVGWDGSRSSTGGITFLAGDMPVPAIFEIRLCQGRNVTITFAMSSTLFGSNGGTLLLEMGPTERGGNNASFPTNNDCNFVTPLRVGGTLDVPGNAIPGIYTGSFNIVFNQE